MPFSPQDHSVWIAETAELSVRITAEALQEMEREVMHGFKALPKRGAEIGGALYGHLTEVHGVRTVSVERVLPIPCEYQSGPSFRLSELDHAKLAAALKAEPQQPLGFFRSHTRTDLELNDEDRLLLQRHFPVDGAVLLIRPLEIGDCECRVYALHAGTVSPEGYGPFSFGWKHRRHEVPEAAVPAPAKVLAPPPDPPPPARTARPALHYVFFAVLFTGACLISYYAGRYTGFVSASTPAVSPFRLTIERVGSSARLSWDGDHPQVRHVPEALLTITDGAQNSVRRLSADELRAGAISYVPATGDVTFELQLPLRSGWLTQSARLISAAIPANHSAAQPSAAAPQVLAQPLSSESAPQAPPPVAPAVASGIPAPPAPVPDPPKPAAAEAVRPQPPDPKAEVSQALRSWSASLRAGDIDSHVSHYGPTLKRYFDKKGIARDDVTQQVRRMAAQHGGFRTHEVQILSIRPIAPDRVAAVIRKRWTTAGSSAGEVEEELELTRRTTRWEIVSEQQTRLLWVRH